MAKAPIVLVPGFWLGAWAWDDVARTLGSRGHDVTAVTLPGLEPDHSNRGAVTMRDHVAAICPAVTGSDRGAVLVVHSGAAIPGYGATDLVADHLAAVVYVDTGPGAAAIDPTFRGDEYPLPSWEQVQAMGNSLEGLSEEHLAAFRARAVPEPGAALREGVTAADDARLAVPSVVVCTSFRPHEYQQAAAHGQMFSALTQLTDVTYLDLPTGHWPMWSQTEALSEIIAAAAGG